MTHKEYSLTVREVIYETLDSESKAVHKKIGEKISVDQYTFDRIKKGDTITYWRTAGHGMTSIVEYSKHNFENEVEVITVNIEKSVAKLGNKK